MTVWIQRAAATAVVAVLALVVISCGYETSSPKEAVAEYSSEFGLPPSPDVTEIHSKQYVIRDTVANWMRFHADGSTVIALLSRGFRPTTEKEFATATGGANIPSWWTTTDGMIFFHKEGWRKDLGQSDAWLGYDARHRLILFHHTAFD